MITKHDLGIEQHLKLTATDCIDLRKNRILVELIISMATALSKTENLLSNAKKVHFKIVKFH